MLRGRPLAGRDGSGRLLFLVGDRDGDRGWGARALVRRRRASLAVRLGSTLAARLLVIAVATAVEAAAALVGAGRALGPRQGLRLELTLVLGVKVQREHVAQLLDLARVLLVHGALEHLLDGLHATVLVDVREDLVVDVGVRQQTLQYVAALPLASVAPHLGEHGQQRLLALAEVANVHRHLLDALHVACERAQARGQQFWSHFGIS